MKACNRTLRTDSARWLVCALCPVSVVLAGCDAAQHDPVDEAARRQALSLLLPARVRVQPFTRLSPDARELLVYIRAEDQFGDPVKVAGTFNLELYSYRKASADRKGTRIELWQARILDRKDQLRYWDHTAQMYELHLHVAHLGEGDSLQGKAGGKAVLLLTYTTAWGEHLEDEYVFELTSPFAAEDGLGDQAN